MITIIIRSSEGAIHLYPLIYHTYKEANKFISAIEPPPLGYYKTNFAIYTDPNMIKDPIHNGCINIDDIVHAQLFPFQTHLITYMKYQLMKRMIDQKEYDKHLKELEIDPTEID